MATYRPIQFLGGTYSAGETGTGAITLGFQFTVSAACSLTAIGFWQPSASATTDTRFLGLWTTTDAATQGSPVCYGTATAPSAGSGWKYSAGLVAADGTTPISSYSLVTGTTYIAGVHHPAGGWSAIGGFFSTGPGAGVSVGPVNVPSTAAAIGTKQGLFYEAFGLNMPINTFGGNNYGVDVQVETAGGITSGWHTSLGFG